MPLYLAHTKPLWGIWRIEESSDELLSRLTRRDARLPFPANVQAGKRKREWLAVRVLLKELLGEETPVAYHAGGAPYLPEKRLHIGISHTKGYAAVILDERAPAGIDIEYRSDRAWKVRKRFMSREELEQIEPPHEAEYALIYWCAKETLFKLLRQSGIDFRKHLRIPPFPYGESGSLTATETFTPQAASYRINYLANERFVVGWYP
jgi:phosphopantetheinyl transferase